MIPAFGYLRVSGRGQLDGGGFDRQRDAIRAFAAKNGYEVIRYFEDGAVSGEIDTADRGGFAEMLALAGPGTATVILIERADRLARKLAVSELACEDARAAGVTIVTADTGTDMTNSDDPSRELIRQIFGVVAQWNKNVTVQRLAKSRQRIRASGQRCEGVRPMETTSDYHAESLSIVLGLRERELSLRDICRHLRAVGRVTPKGGTWWSASTVHQMIERHPKKAPFGQIKGLLNGLLE